MHLPNSRVWAVLTGVFLFIAVVLGTAHAAQGAAPQTSAGQQQPAEPPPPIHSQPPPPQGQPPQGQPPVDNSGVFVFKKEVEEVVIHATVVDKKDHMVLNLGRNAFSVFENEKPQTITSFRHEDIPVAMGIVIDNSGSMREKREKVNKAALDLVASSNPQDQVFVVNFNDEYYLDQDFTGDVRKLKKALEKVDARGGTALYDAMVASADQLKKSKLQRKVLFVVTDGEDNASQETLEKAVRRLDEENGPTVYAIGLLGGKKGKGEPNARWKPWHCGLAGSLSCPRRSMRWTTSAVPWPTTSVPSTRSATNPPLPKALAATGLSKLKPMPRGMASLRCAPRMAIMPTNRRRQAKTRGAPMIFVRRHWTSAAEAASTSERRNCAPAGQPRAAVPTWSPPIPEVTLTLHDQVP